MIYRCDRCDTEKDGDYDSPTEVGNDSFGEVWCESCSDLLPDDIEDWNIFFWSKPIPDRNHDWEAVHIDYDGAPDSGDTRAFTGPNILSLIEQINEFNDNG